jgi:hypothetical protein
VPLNGLVFSNLDGLEKIGAPMLYQNQKPMKLTVKTADKLIIDGYSII